MKPSKFSISNRLNSFVYAFNGLRILMKDEHNARIHLVVAIGVIIAGIYFSISTNEWMAIFLSIGLVVCMEILNTCIENIADFISPERNDKIKQIKDLAASAVLVAAVTASATGLIIFVPRILAWI